MHNLTIKEPRAPQEYMTSVHGDYVTPNVVLVSLTNTQRQETSLRYLQTLTLITLQDTSQLETGL